MTWWKRIFGLDPIDLAVVNLVANLALAAIMGSATAQMAIMTRTMVPEMERAGYNRGYATALTASAGMCTWSAWRRRNSVGTIRSADRITRRAARSPYTFSAKGG